jgi:hypothetical protein
MGIDDLFFTSANKAISDLSKDKECLLGPDDAYNRKNTVESFYKIYDTYADNEISSRMLRSFFKFFGFRFLFLLFVRVYVVLSEFSGPMIMGRILGITTGSLDISENDRHYCYFLVLAFIFMNFLKIIIQHYYEYGLKKFESQVEIIVSDLAFKKILRLKSNVSQLDAKVTRLLNDDYWYIANFFENCNYLWELPFNIIFALYATYLQVSYAFIPGLLFVIVLLYVNSKIAMSVNKTNDEITHPRLNKKDMELIALKNIKSVKFFSMEKYFLNKILVKFVFYPSTLERKKWPSLHLRSI